MKKSIIIFSMVAIPFLTDFVSATEANSNNMDQLDLRQVWGPDKMFKHFSLPKFRINTLEGLAERIKSESARAIMQSFIGKLETVYLDSTKDIRSCELGEGIIDKIVYSTYTMLNNSKLNGDVIQRKDMKNLLYLINDNSNQEEIRSLKFEKDSNWTEAFGDLDPDIRSGDMLILR